jgi:NTE family protein
LQDKSERDFRNQLPMTFVLPDASVDRLRPAAATIMLESAVLREVLKDIGARMVGQPKKRPAGP